jgi:hypothetical protein
MDHMEVLKEAWHMVWRHRALWIFGIILALTTFSWETAVLYSRHDDGDGSRDRATSRIILPDNRSMFGNRRVDDAGDIVINYSPPASFSWLSSWLSSSVQLSRY